MRWKTTICAAAALVASLASGAAFAEKSGFGSVVIILMAPPTALRPYRVPCGPLRTSILSTSLNWNRPLDARAIYSSSRYTELEGSSPTFGRVDRIEQEIEAGIAQHRLSRAYHLAEKPPGYVRGHETNGRCTPRSKARRVGR